MLVTCPSARAKLSEVMDYPGMKRGFSGHPDPHLVPRKLLRPDGLNDNVIYGMGGFRFGTEEGMEKHFLRFWNPTPAVASSRTGSLSKPSKNPPNDIVDDKHQSSLSDASLGYGSTEIDSITPTSKN